MSDGSTRGYRMTDDFEVHPVGTGELLSRLQAVYKAAQNYTSSLDGLNHPGETIVARNELRDAVKVLENE